MEWVLWWAMPAIVPASLKVSDEGQVITLKVAKLGIWLQGLPGYEANSNYLNACPYYPIICNRQYYDPGEANYLHMYTFIF